MITARDLSVQGDQHQLILNQISANFPPGQIHVIMGPNGSGKSTLLRCLCSLQPIKEGSIELAGRRASSFGIKELATLLSWTEAEHASPFAYRVQDVILWGRWHIHEGAPSIIDIQKAQHAASRMGLDKLMARDITTLSLGERKKTHLARALASEVPYYIWDEPCAALDISASIALMHLSRQLCTEGKTIIMSLHDIDMALHFADTISVLKDGYLLWSGTPRDKSARDHLSSAFGILINDQWGQESKYSVKSSNISSYS